MNDEMSPIRRRIAEIHRLGVASKTLHIRADTTSNQEPTSTIAPYYKDLNGVNQPMNMMFKDIMWWTLGAAAMAVLAIRIGQLMWANLRLVTVMSSPAREKQGYWRLSQWNWMPFFKKQVIYAPLRNKRHNREFRLSKAISMGTLPSRLHFIIIVFYLLSNIIYMFVLDYTVENKYAFCAELRGRSGTLALINMVPLIIFAGRNNPLVGLLQISFDTYNLLHRWMGRLVVLDTIIHTIAWAIPAVADLGWDGAMRKLGNHFYGSGTIGVVALVILFLTALSPVRHAFYETFLNLHIFMAFVIFVMTIVHCVTAHLKGGLPQLPWILAIMALWFADRLARFIRLAYANYYHKTFTYATCEPLDGEVTRVTMHLPRYIDVKPGTHAYVRFGGISPWESHPFSIAWVEHNDYTDELPVCEKDPLAIFDRSKARTDVTFIIGAQTGMTRKLFNAATVGCQDGSKAITIKAAMEGPYAGHHSLDSYGHCVLFAGSTGITHQLSYLRHLLNGYNAGTVATRRVTLVWIIRDYKALEWVRPYMDAILKMPKRKDLINIQIYVTRPQTSLDRVSLSSTVRLLPGRPNIPLLLVKEISEQTGAMCVTVCGPGALADDVRGAVRAVQGETVVDFVEESFTW